MDAPYVRLGITLGLAAGAMFLVLRLTIGSPGLEIEVALIALMLTAPVGVLMLLVMPHLFRSLRANLILYAAFALLFLSAYAATQSGALAGDQARVTQALARS